MRRLFQLLLPLLLIPAAALSMSQSSVPPKFPIPWGNSAGSAYVRSIPTPSQIGIQNCAASLTDGFPPLTFVPSSAGGCPPFGQDFNGILKQVTQWNQWVQAGGPVFYDSAFASAIGGYPSGAKVASAVVPGNAWMSTADNNATNPDAGGANWVQDPGQIQTGTPVAALTTVIPAGQVSANGTSIGDASSGGTDRANADTQFLFAFVWANCPQAQCPVAFSGTPVARGASAAADFAAHRTISVWNLNGTALMGADSQHGSTSTQLNGVTVVSGNSTTPGSIFGENTGTFTVSQLPTVTPVLNLNLTFDFNFTSNGGAGASQGQVTGITSAGGGTLVTVQNNSSNVSPFGSNAIHNEVARSALVYWNLKL